MSAVTDRFDLPYPETIDPPAGAPQIRALAEAVDATLVRVCEGSINIPAASGLGSGAVFPGTPQTINYASAGFTRPPSVIAATQSAPSGIPWVSVRVTAVTATSCQVLAYNSSNQNLTTGGAITVSIVAFES